MDDQNRPDQPEPTSEPPQAPQPPAPPTAPQPAQPYYQPQLMPQSNGKAMGALICGVLAILFAGLPLIGIILGIVAIVMAVKAAKESGKDGKTTGGKVCGIIGIVLSVIAFILYLVIGFGLLALIAANSDDVATISPGSASSQPAPDALGASSSSTETEQQIEQAAASQFQKLKEKDPAIVQSIATEADEALYNSAGYHLSDLGIDATTLVEWMLDDFDFDMDGASDYQDGTGTAYADITMRDMMSFAMTFQEEVAAASEAGDFEVTDEAALAAHFGELLQSAMDQTTGAVSDYLSLDMEQVNGTWQVNEDSWEAALEYLFGL